MPKTLAATLRIALLACIVLCLGYGAYLGNSHATHDQALKTIVLALLPAIAYCGVIRMERRTV